MLLVLHLDDNPVWLGNVSRHFQNVREILAEGRPQPVRVISCPSVGEARNVVNGTDRELRDYAAKGYRLYAVILDLMVSGGNKQDLDNWRTAINELADGHATLEGSKIDLLCPALAVGRMAARQGARVIILTNIGKPLKGGTISPEQERALIMKAAGACAYVVKSDDTSCYREIVRAMA